MSLNLLVEDNDKTLKLLRNVLQHKGYETVEAMTGLNGSRLALERMFDVVLMGIQLPDIDGITALARLRADPATQKIPVIAVSASVIAMSQRIIASRFDAYIIKPINVKNVIATVEKCSGKRG